MSVQRHQRSEGRGVHDTASRPSHWRQPARPWPPRRSAARTDDGVAGDDRLAALFAAAEARHALTRTVVAGPVAAARVRRGVADRAGIALPGGLHPRANGVPYLRPSACSRGNTTVRQRLACMPAIRSNTLVMAGAVAAHRRCPLGVGSPQSTWWNTRRRGSRFVQGRAHDRRDARRVSPPSSSACSACCSS